MHETNLQQRHANLMSRLPGLLAGLSGLAAMTVLVDRRKGVVDRPVSEMLTFAGPDGWRRIGDCGYVCLRFASGRPVLTCHRTALSPERGLEIGGLDGCVAAFDLSVFPARNTGGRYLQPGNDHLWRAALDMADAMEGAITGSVAVATAMSLANYWLGFSEAARPEIEVQTAARELAVAALAGRDPTALEFMRCPVDGVITCIDRDGQQQPPFVAKLIVQVNGADGDVFVLPYSTVLHPGLTVGVEITRGFWCGAPCPGTRFESWGDVERAVGSPVYAEAIAEMCVTAVDRRIRGEGGIMRIRRTGDYAWMPLPPRNQQRPLRTVFRLSKYWTGDWDKVVTAYEDCRFLLQHSEGGCPSVRVLASPELLRGVADSTAYDFLTLKPGWQRWVDGSSKRRDLV